MRIPNVVGGHLDFSDVKRATKPNELDNSEALQADDLLIIHTNGSRDLIGRAALVREELNQACFFASYLIRYRIVHNPPLAMWLITIWNSQVIRTWIEGIAATSAGQYNVSIGSLNKLPIPLAPLPEQTHIIAEVERCLSVVAEVEATTNTDLARAERLRQSILKRAFSGKLVPQDPDDESASDLLDHLHSQRRQSVPQQLALNGDAPA